MVIFSETKRNETKRNETKRNETKRNETKRNETKRKNSKRIFFYETKNFATRNINVYSPAVCPTGGHGHCPTGRTVLTYDIFDSLHDPIA